MFRRFYRWVTGHSSETDLRRAEEATFAANTESRFYRQEKHAKHLIVFVHGVFGSLATTWGQGAAYWPSLIVGDERFNGYDIYLVNYLTARISTSANVHEVAGNELQRLKDRRVFEAYDEIHFIAHSMGGLVTKSMLVRLAREAEGNRLHRVRSVVYLATPAQGAPIAELASWLSLNPQLANMTRAHANAFLQSLEDEWVGLLINRDRARARFPRVHCAYETLPLHGVLVVPRELAYSRSDGELQPMPFDHHGITTPTTRNADPYAWTMARLQEAGDFDRIIDRIDSLLNGVDALTVSGHHDEARRSCDEATTLSRQLGDLVVQARALTELASFELAAGRSDESRARFTEALVLCRTDPQRRGEARILFGLGQLDRLVGRHEEARTFFTEARSAFRADDDKLGEADVLRGLGELERLLGRNEPARRCFDDALNLYRQAQKPRGEAEVLVGIGNIELHTGRFDEARVLFNKASEIFKASDDHRGLGYGLFGLANVELLQGHSEPARANLEAARRAFHQSAVGRRGQAHVLVALGGLDFKLGYPDRARTAWDEAKALYRAIGDQLGEANTLRRLGDLEHYLGNNDDAIAAYVEARALYRREESRHGEANALLGLAEVARSRGRYDLARTQYTEACALYREVQNPQGQAQALSGIGGLECSLRRLEVADTSFREALSLVQDQKYPLDEANVLCGIGELENARGRGEHAGTAYTRAKILFKAEGDRRGEADAQCGLGDQAAKIGTYEEALKIYETALSISLDTRYQLGQATALLGTARVEYLLERLADARAHASDASNLYRRIENPLGEAQSLALRGRIEANADPELSLRYNAQAQLLYDMLGVAPS